MLRLLVLVATTVTIACLCLCIEASGPPPVAEFKNLFEYGLQMHVKGGMSHGGRAKRDETTDVRLPAPLEKMRTAFMALLTEPEEELDETAEARGKKPKKPKRRPPFWRDRKIAKSLRRKVIFLFKYFNGGGFRGSPGLTGMADLMMSFNEELTTTPADTTTAGLD